MTHLQIYFTFSIILTLFGRVIYWERMPLWRWVMMLVAGPIALVLALVRAGLEWVCEEIDGVDDYMMGHESSRFKI